MAVGCCVQASKCLLLRQCSVAIQQGVWEGLHVIRMLDGLAAKNIAASGSGMGCSGIPQSVDMCQKKECDT